MPDDTTRLDDVTATAVTPHRGDHSDAPAPQEQPERPPTDPALRRAWERDRAATSSAETPPDEPPTLDDDLVDRLTEAVADRLARADTNSDRPPHLLGHTVWFRSRTGRWTAPAIITATHGSLYQPNVDAGHLPPLGDEDDRVHLTVLTPGRQGHVSDETRDTHPELVADDRPNKPAGGSFQEWDIPLWTPGPDVDLAVFEYVDQPAGTWMWPL